MNEDPICPTCRVNALMLNSDNETFTCVYCKTQVGLYDKGKHKLILNRIYP